MCSQCVLKSGVMWDSEMVRLGDWRGQPNVECIDPNHLFPNPSTLLGSSQTIIPSIGFHLSLICSGY